ncbi:choice-of-anchor D domain-containing protein [uncultured Flavobacterium sp.]|uniref:choice-of-anchor D domain-containing protein n=1 Tax=uncultured Flavobacterium sp. TaxID=165435 RepID=UPI0030C7FB84
MKKLLLAIILLCSFISFGQSIFENPITDSNPSASNPYTNGQIVNPNITVSGIGRGTGISGSNANNRYNASGWDNTVFDVNDYFQFTLTPNTGFAINFTNFIYTSQASGTGPTNFVYRSSVDGFSSNIGTALVTGTTISLTAGAYQNITTPITFRIYGWGASGSGGTFSINDFTFNGTVVATGPISITSGDWNVGSTWNTGIVPSATDNVTISSGDVVHTNTSLTRNGNTQVNGTFELRDGGFASGTGTFTYNATTGTLNFNASSSYGVDNTHVYWPTTNGPFNVSVLSGGVTLNAGANRTVNGLFSTAAGVTFGSSTLTLNGTCRINGGGFFNNAPIYGASSTLLYNTAGTFNRGIEWIFNGVGTIGTTPGYPNNIQLGNNTTLDYNNGTPLNKAIAGNLTIDAGSSFYMDYGGLPSGGTLTVAGNIVNNGNFTLGNAIGDDLRLNGNFTNNGVFNGNGRAIFFTKNGTQTITSTPLLTIPYIVQQPSSGTNTIQLINDLIVSAPAGGNAISFSSAADIFDINSRTLTIGTVGVANTISGSGTFKGSTTSNLILFGNGSLGTLSFTLGSQILGNLTLNRQAGVIGFDLGTDLSINSTLLLTNGILNTVDKTLTITNSGLITGGNALNYIIADYTAGGFLRKNFNAVGAFIFPIGDRVASADGSQYSPITINFTAATFSSGYVSLNVEDSKEPNNEAPTDYITRYWNLIGSGITNATYNVTGTYLPVDINGTELNYKSGRYATSNSTWTEGPNVIGGSNTIILTGLTSATGALTSENHYTAGNPFKGAEIDVQGNGVSIADGDTTPSVTDDTSFGSVVTNTNTTHVFTIQNSGNLDLILPSNSISLSNTTNGFSVTQPSLLTIPPGSSTTFSVTFNSAVAGTFTNTISIINNDLNENPYDFAINATAFVPVPEINIARDQSSTDIPSGSAASTGYNTIFAALNIGSSSNKTYYIENEGTATLTIGAVTITGANPGDFSISAISSTIAVGSVLTSSIPFTITFTPQASGVRTATISIVNNDSNENPYTFDVQGTGNCPSYTTTLSPSSGPVGTTVYITSSMNLSGANTVTLNGTSLPVTVISPTQISVVIPSGAITGNLIVGNSQGCSTTNTFTIIDNLTSGCEGGGTSATNLFISQVTDANTGGLSYIELYNGTGTSINLGTYRLELYNNGSSTNNGGSVSLPSFSLASGGVYVVAVGTGGATCSGVTGSDGSLANLSSGISGINFNVGENDHIKLFNNTTEIDRWGVYTSNNWADGLGLGTEGANFVRKSTATAPSLTYNNNDWNIIEWTDCSNNSYSTIGAHNFSSGTPPTITSQPTYTPNCGTVVLTTTASEGFTGGFGLVYQWYVNIPGNSTWTALTDTGVYSGTTSATLSISSTAGLNNYQYYCQIRENSATCYTATNAVKISDDITTWNGSAWSYGAPTLNRKAIINGNYITASHGDFECCVLEINASNTLTVSADGYVVIENNIINNGNVIVSLDGSIVQVNEADTNSGTYTGTAFQVHREAQARNLDYVYWSSPVENFNVSNLPNSHRYKWFPTAPNPNSTQGNWLAASGTMAFGEGYIARASNGSSAAVALPITFQGGKPHNGQISVPIERGFTTGTDDSWNLLGNPYPSAMDADSFLTDNTNIEGSVRIWMHGTLPAASPSPFYQNFTYNYTEDDYIVYNGTATSIPATFNGKIASGQGFFVRMLEDGETDITPPTNTTTAATSSVLFKNAYRRASDGSVYDNSEFFKNSSSTNEKSRIWLDLISPNNAVTRTVVGYVPGATLAKDRIYDALIDVDAFKLYTLINTQKQAIQGRPVPFDANDLVPMGMFIETAGNYTVAIAAVDGLFLDASQNIYLEDKLLNIIHNLKLAPYTFSTIAGEFNDRFVLRYTNAVLSNQHFEITNGLVIASNHKVSLLAYENIQSVVIFDVLGRKIYDKNNINSTEVVLDHLTPTKEALIVKTIFEDGKVVTKKIIY